MANARTPTRLASLTAAGAVVLALACKAETPAPPAAASAPASTVPLDRLGPDELAVGDGDVFGLPVPRGMAVIGRAPDSALLFGEVTPEAVVNYVRERVVVSHMELADGRTIFPRARIKDGPTGRVFRIDVLRDFRATKLVLTDVTPPPPPPPGLSDAERWRRAGFSPDGRPLDLKRLE
jgi:hypothetical protein